MFLFSFNNDFIAILPELFLIFSLSLLLFYSVIFSTSFFFDFPLLVNNVSWLCIYILLIVLYLNLHNSFYDITALNNLIIIDVFGVLAKSFILVISVCSFLMSLRYNRKEPINSFEFPIFIMLSILGTLLIISSYDLLSVYLAIELQSFCSYILSSMKRNSEFSSESGLKYFVLGAFSSGFLLFGCSLIYGFTGVTNYRLLSLLILNYDCSFLNGLVIGSFFIIVAFLFKLSAAPFHIWTPDIYEGAPTMITGFFAIVLKLGLLLFFLRLFYDPFYRILNFWQIFILISSCSSMIVGCFGAIWQLKLKRLFAFSTIGHVGYMLIGLCCVSFESIFSLIFYSFVYSLMNVSSFSILLIVSKQFSLQRIKYNEDLTILTKTNPFLGICLAITFFSIAGMPPLAGFFSKMFVFFNSICSDLYVLAIVGILTSVISCFYYLRLIKISFFDRLAKWLSITRLNKESAFLISCINLILTMFFIHSSFLIIFIHFYIFDFCMF